MKPMELLRRLWTREEPVSLSSAIERAFAVEDRERAKAGLPHLHTWSGVGIGASCTTCNELRHRERIEAARQQTATIDYLPIWKKNAPAHERLYELAEVARKRPERFSKWVIVYCEDTDKTFSTRYMNGESTRSIDCLAVLQAGIQSVWDSTTK